METDQVKRTKSANALRTIGEVSEYLNLPAHVLRFWESKFSQIKPIKRRGGHRYYRPEDIDILREVRSLLYDRGYTIKGAQKYLKDNNGKKDIGNDVIVGADNGGISTPPVHVGSENHFEQTENKKRLKRILNELVEIKQMLNSTDEQNL